MKFSLLLSRILTVILTLFLGPTMTGQTFQPVLSPLLSQEVHLEQANECYIYLQNPSGDTLRLKWRQLEMSLPAGWDIDLCDYGTCYIGVPPNGSMNPVYDTVQPYLKLIVQPGTTPGMAWCWFRVQEVDNSANFLDVYFSLFTPGVTGTVAVEEPSIQVFPNPARDFLVIDHPAARTVAARLVDVTGRTVWQADMAPQAQTRISVAGWPAGLYFLQMGNQTRRVVIERQ